MDELLNQPDVVWDIIKSISGVMVTLVTVSGSILLWIIKRYIGKKDLNDDKLIKSIGKLDIRFAVMEGKADNLSAAIKYIEENNNSIAQKFDDFEKRVVEKLDKLMVGHATIEYEQKGIQGRLKAHEAELSAMKDRINRLELKITNNQTNGKTV